LLITMPKSKKQSYDQRRKKRKEAMSVIRSVSLSEVKEQLDNTEPNRKSYTSDNTNDINNKNSLSSTFDRKRKSNEITTDMSYGTKRRGTDNTDASIRDSSSIVTEENFQNDRINDIIDQSQSDNVNNDPSDVDTLPITLPKIIFGDFSQNSNEFPKPKTQCTAMAAVALAYASLKSIILWNANDLNTILRLGQIYYENSMSHLLENTPIYDSTYLEVAHLLKNLEMECYNRSAV